MRAWSKALHKFEVIPLPMKIIYPLWLLSPQRQSHQVIILEKNVFNQIKLTQSTTKGLWFFGLGWLVCANLLQFGFEKVIATPLRINVLISHAVFTAKLMKYYWISALLKLQFEEYRE